MSIQWELKWLPLALLHDPDLDLRAYRSPSFKVVLKSSLEHRGLYDPLKVRRKPDGRFEILDGLTRKQKLAELGYERVPCLVTNVDDDTALSIQAHLGYTRARLDSIAISRYMQIQRGKGKKLREIGAEFNIGKAQVSKILSLLKLSPEDQMLVASGKLSINEGYALVQKRWHREQRLGIDVSKTARACQFCGDVADVQQHVINFFKSNLRDSLFQVPHFIFHTNSPS